MKTQLTLVFILISFSFSTILNVNGEGENLVDANEKAYDLVKKINWPDYYYRKDIGWRALKD